MKNHPLFAAIFLFSTTQAPVLLAQQAASHSAQTVITMRGDYSIVPAGDRDDGKNYKLNRLAKDKSVFETIPITKVAESNGSEVYSGPNGKYTRLSNGTLQETLILSDTPVIQAPEGEPALTLLRSLPQAPRAAGLDARRLDSITLPEGAFATRSDTLEGRQVTLLTTGFNHGRPHEVAVGRAGEKNGEVFYVRISTSSKSDEPQVFGVSGDRVTGYAALPQGIPQLSPSQISASPIPSSFRRADGLAAQQASRPVPNRVPAAPPASAAVRVEYQGRNGSVFTRSDSRSDATGVHTYFHLDGNDKSWELIPLRSGDRARFTLLNSDATYIAIDRGQLKATDSNSGKPAELGPPGSPVTPVGESAPHPAFLLEGKGAGLASQPASSTHNFSIRQTAGGQAGNDRTWEIKIYPTASQAAGPIIVKASPGQENNPAPGVFIQDEASRLTVYTAVDMPKEQGGPLLTVMMFSKAAGAARPR